MVKELDKKMQAYMKRCKKICKPHVKKRFLIWLGNPKKHIFVVPYPSAWNAEHSIFDIIVTNNYLYRMNLPITICQKTHFHDPAFPTHRRGTLTKTETCRCGTRKSTSWNT